MEPLPEIMCNFGLGILHVKRLIMWWDYTIHRGVFNQYFDLNNSWSDTRTRYMMSRCKTCWQMYVLSSFLQQLDVITPFQLYFNPDLILNHLQVSHAININRGILKQSACGTTLRKLKHTEMYHLSCCVGWYIHGNFPMLRTQW